MEANAKTKAKCWGLLAALRTMVPSAASVERTASFVEEGSYGAGDGRWIGMEGVY
jgi:hypothetical protein